MAAGFATGLYLAPLDGNTLPRIRLTIPVASALSLIYPCFTSVFLLL